MTATEIVEACQELAERSWVANHDGNISIRRPRDGFLVTPTAFRKRDVRAVDLLVIDDKISVFVPNAFTPASDGIGDGINDGFKPVIRGINLIQKYRFQVFDRWGTVIFETFDYDEYWKGDVYRGREDTFDYFAQNEVYNWKVTLTLPGEEADEVELGSNPFCNGPRQFCGHVSLIR